MADRPRLQAAAAGPNRFGRRAALPGETDQSEGRPAGSPNRARLAAKGGTRPPCRWVGAGHSCAEDHFRVGSGWSFAKGRAASSSTSPCSTSQRTARALALASVTRPSSRLARAPTTPSWAPCGPTTPSSSDTGIASMDLTQRLNCGRSLPACPPASKLGLGGDGLAFRPGSTSSPALKRPPPTRMSSSKTPVKIQLLQVPGSAPAFARPADALLPRQCSAQVADAQCTSPRTASGLASSGFH